MVRGWGGSARGGLGGRRTAGGGLWACGWRADSHQLPGWFGGRAGQAVAGQLGRAGLRAGGEGLEGGAGWIGAVCPTNGPDPPGSTSQHHSEIP